MLCEILLFYFEAAMSDCEEFSTASKLIYESTEDGARVTRLDSLVNKQLWAEE